jgi:integrase
MGQIRKRGRNHGLRKVCECSRRKWAKCPHSWHFNFKLKGGQPYRFSIDSEVGKHVAKKEDAETHADTFRIAIRDGTFRRRAEAPPINTASTSADVTLETFGGTYAERLGKPVSVNHRSCFKQFCAFTAPGTATRYGARLLTAFTEDDLEAFFAHLQAKSFAESTRNKYVQMVKALFRWATKKGYLARNPASDSEILKRRKHAQRHRRLDPGEEGKLLEHAGPHLQRLILAALETGCRRGELLTLTWRDVNLDRREMTIRAERTKTRTARVLPISERLTAVLKMANTDPAGKEFGPEAHVFGDVTGQQVKDIKKAWETCILKAHGHTPTWTRDNAPSSPSREALRAADLTFHDLRHEAGSRLLEAGWPLHNVAHMLGHANISQTSTYLNATRVGLQDAMRRLDEARGCKPVANETDTERAPLRNEETQNTPNHLIN